MNSINSTIDRDVLISSYSFVNYITENTKRFQNVLETAAKICNVKSAFITLLGNTKQDILSQSGIQLNRMYVKKSICQYTIQGRDLLMIPDTSKDYRIKKLGMHESKHKMFFYAGYPLYNNEDYCIGALCVCHDQPGNLNNIQKSLLSTLASNTMYDLDNQRHLMNMILNLNRNYRVKQMPDVSSLQLELTKQHNKIKEQNKIIEQQHNSLLQSNENLRTFAYIAAHDIKSPARVIYSFAQLLNDKLKSSLNSKPLMNYTNIIQQASNNLIDLVSSILIYAETDTKKMELSTIPLKDILDTVKFNLGEAIQSSKAEIIDMTSSHYVNGHPEQLIQLFQNLISNGIKYQDGSHAPIIKIECKTFKSKLAISVSDNGIGIKDKNKYKIFEPFKRLHSSSTYPGSGLGLSTCLRVIENHNSHICIESNPSEGTTFTFALTKSYASNMETGERVKD